ncbi:MAG TPA: hypothetical protein VFF04_04885 [Candidatus Babeliales bacterium]|nr:hypothetical protein [Candidatus Babeliales bacterium]
MNIRSGFLFFELMIALALITGFALLIAYQQMAIIGWKQSNNMRLKALDKCNALIEQIIISGQLPMQSSIIDDGITITWSAKPYYCSVSFEGQSLNAPDCIFFETVGAWYSNDNKSYQIKVNTIMHGVA